MTDNTQNSETQNPAAQNSAAENKPANGGAAAAAQKSADNQPNRNPAADTGSSSVTETVSQAATEAAGQAKDKAVSLIGEQKSNLASGINSVADSIRQIGDNLRADGEGNQITAFAGKYGDSLAGQVENFSKYVEQSDFKDVARDLEKFARRNPAIFVGSAFALGVLAARFLKSSGSGQSRESRNRSGGAAVQAS